MINLGFTRAARRADHILHTPDTFVRAPLPGMRNSTAVVHVSPAAGARFTHYTAEFGADGGLGPCAHSRFVYVMEGELHVGGQLLAEGGYAYLPPGDATAIRSAGAARASVIEKE